MWSVLVSVVAATPIPALQPTLALPPTPKIQRVPEVLVVGYALGNETVHQMADRLSVDSKWLQGLNGWRNGSFTPAKGARHLYKALQHSSADADGKNILFNATGFDNSKYQAVMDELTCSGVTDEGLRQLGLTRVGSPAGDGGYLISDMVLKASVSTATPNNKCLIYGFGINYEYTCAPPRLSNLPDWHPARRAIICRSSAARPSARRCAAQSRITRRPSSIATHTGTTRLSRRRPTQPVEIDCLWTAMARQPGFLGGRFVRFGRSPRPGGAVEP